MTGHSDAGVQGYGDAGVNVAGVRGPRRVWRFGVLAAAGALTIALAGCGSSSSGGGDNTVTVFAAASLNKVFTDLGKQFQASHPGTTVRFSFGGSSDLVTQLNQGAPADVFASADPNNMNKAVKGGRITEKPQDFATNVLTIVTPPGNPKHVASLADLAQPDLRLVVCAPPVPCGAATQKVTKAANVQTHPVSEEQSVTDVLTKVTSGEADAGLVYVTDAKSAGSKVTAVPFPESASAVNTYPIAVVQDSKHADAAHQFETFVTGPEGRAALAQAGFGAP